MSGLSFNYTPSSVGYNKEYIFIRINRHEFFVTITVYTYQKGLTIPDKIIDFGILTDYNVNFILYHIYLTYLHVDNA